MIYESEIWFPIKQLPNQPTYELVILHLVKIIEEKLGRKPASWPVIFSPGLDADKYKVVIRNLKEYTETYNVTLTMILGNDPNSNEVQIIIESDYEEFGSIAAYALVLHYREQSVNNPNYTPSVEEEK